MYQECFGAMSNAGVSNKLAELIAEGTAGACCTSAVGAACCCYCGCGADGAGYS